MGTSKSKPSQKGQIFVQTQKEMYFVNETINGQVCLNVQQSGFPAGIVQLRFVGKDYAKRVEQRGSRKNRHTVRIIINSKFINCPIQLQDYGKELPVTQVIFPFKVALNLQTMTYDYHFCANNWAHIKFYLVAQVVNNPKKKMDEVIKYKLPITIVKQYIPMIRPVKINRRENIVFLCCCCRCCCCRNGYAIYDYDIPKTDFKFGETLNMSLTVDLFNCQKEILSIEMWIQGKCVVSHYEKTEYQMFYNSQQLEGISAGQKKTFNISLILNKEKSGGGFEFQSTSVSPKINYSYFASFYYKYKGCNCCFKSEDHIPITIIRPPKKAQIKQIKNSEFKLPVTTEQSKEWKPTTQKEVTLVVNQQQNNNQVQIQYQANQTQKVHPEENYNNYHAYNNNYQPVPQSQESQFMPQSKQEHQPIQNHKIQDNPFG